jgi:glutamate formiminotransferase/formiminotetrahydrofolate cyclodeaminase
VVEAIRREASRFGVMIHHAELVGLIPQAALVEAAVWYLQLDQFKPEQILEQKLYILLQAPQTVEQSANGADFLDALSAGTATPGGGSAAAFSAAAAASLVSMVARLTIGKKKYAQVEPQVQAILTQAEALRNDLTLAIQLDASAFEAVMAANKLPKDAQDQQEVRQKAIEQATLLAIQAPMGVAHKSLRVLELAEQIIRLGNASALSDAATGAALANAAFIGAGYNIRINARQLPTATSSAFLTELAELEKNVVKFEAHIRTALHERGL